MRVHVDLTLCQGYANCVTAAPDVFEIDDSGLAMLLMPEVGHDQRDAVRAAIRLCPTRAISSDEDLQ